MKHVAGVPHSDSTRITVIAFSRVHAARSALMAAEQTRISANIVSSPANEYGTRESWELFALGEVTCVTTVSWPRTHCARASSAPGAALYSGWPDKDRIGGRMGIKWTARLRVDFEMEEGAPENLAQIRLRTAVGQLEHFIEKGAGIGKTLVKQGSAKVEIVAQGPTAAVGS
jgi:hypothetical protein